MITTIKYNKKIQYIIVRIYILGDTFALLNYYALGYTNGTIKKIYLR